MNSITTLDEQQLVNLPTLGTTTELISGPFSLTRTGLVVEGEPTPEEWDQAGNTLCQAHGALQWWIGDWLLYGEGKPEWGSKYAAARERFGRESQVLKDYKSVAKAVQLSLRNDNCTAFATDL